MDRVTSRDPSPPRASGALRLVDRWATSIRITHEFSRLDRALFWLAVVGIPAALLAISLGAWLRWAPTQAPESPHPVAFRVLPDAQGQWDWAAAAARLPGQAAAQQHLDTHLSTAPHWLSFPLGTSAQRWSLPSRHATEWACWLAPQGQRLGHATRTASQGEIAPFNAGFVLNTPPGEAGRTALCRVRAEGPARLTVEALDDGAWLQGLQRFERHAGLVDGGLMILAGFLALAALINRNVTYLLFAAWMVLNLRMAALSGGWDVQWLGHRIPAEWLTPLRHATVAAFFLCTYALFRRFFAQELARVRHPRVLAAAGLVAALNTGLAAVLPFEAYLKATWVLAPLGIALLVGLLARILWVTRSRVALWWAAAIGVTLAASLHEVVAAAWGYKALIGHFNHVTSALLASLLAVAAVAQQIKQERVARREAKAKLLQTYDAMPLGLFTVARDGTWLAANPAMHVLMGEPPLDLGHERWAARLGDASWQRLIDATAAGEAIEFSVPTPGPESDAARLMARATWAGDVLEGSLQDVTERAKATERLRFLAEHDSLTQVLNRRGIQRALEQALADLRAGEHLCIAYLDLDRFKLINDLYGHPAGDEVLLQVCQRVQGLLSPGMTFGRVGGDEFLLLMPQLPVDLAALLCQGMTTAIGQEVYRVGERAFQVGGSVGLAEIAAGTSAKDAIATADRACRAAKRGTPLGLVVYEHDASDFAEHHAEMALVQRLATRQPLTGLFVEMQPIMSLSQPRGSLNFEVLLRMQDADGQRVPVGRLIQAAEQTGRMGEVDRWVLAHVLGWLRQHEAQLTRTQFVCMNLSGSSLNDERFLEDAFALLKGHLDVAHHLCLEVTESVALHDLANTRRFIHQVRQTGAKVALDDFGAGYTSFSYLAELPADLLKIDGSFIVHMNQHPAHISIVEAVVSLAHNLGMKTVAEWAEDAATVETLAEIGVDYVQGYAIAKPMAPERLVQHASCADFLSSDEMRQLARRLETLGRTPDLVVGAAPSPVGGGGH
ncbi:EAL domain-containing protein [Inhella crocodyli]|uniref:EAL domain-containing protein n=1 Tax=Inhella crocodyli TaxID=2499851 RepID=A0A437LC18_9BURK|nr:EAL domain-containing protein [Inhella crocodyli]